MKKLLIIILFMFVYLIGNAGSLGVLKEVLKPDNFSIFNDELYIIEGAEIFIYSLANLELKIRFGKKGEGPGELKVVPNYSNNVTGYPDFILAESTDKIVYYSRTGKLLREIKKPSLTFKILPLGRNFVLKKLEVGSDKKVYSTVCIYGADMKMKKKLYSQKFVQQGSEPGSISFAMIPDFINFLVVENKLYIEESPKGFFIEVFDTEGNLLFSINKDIKAVRVTKTLRQRAINEFKQDPFIKTQIKLFGGWTEARKIFRMTFPKSLPQIQNIGMSDNLFLIQTSRQKNNTQEMVIMDSNLKIKKSIFVPRVANTPLTLKMIGVKRSKIANSKIYYLKENENSEQWELWAENLDL